MRQELNASSDDIVNRTDDRNSTFLMKSADQLTSQQSRFGHSADLATEVTGQALAATEPLIAVTEYLQYFPRSESTLKHSGGKVHVLNLIPKLILILEPY
tara:strand:- start:88 stop:387 length:300 start_codon:yes stop_codon:yes gene_type:complete